MDALSMAPTDMSTAGLFWANLYISLTYEWDSGMYIVHVQLVLRFPWLVQFIIA